MSESLKKKTVRGTFWSAVDNIANQGITFLVGLVLARLLSPHEYGLIGYIMIIIAVLNSIVDSGFSNALIRKKDILREDYDTTFIFNLVLSLFMVAVMYFSAPWISRFLKEPELVPLIRVMSVVVVINAFSIIQYTNLVKKVDFRTQAKVSIISSVSSGVVGISMALCDMGVWSLAGQQITRQSFNAIFLWIFNRWIPSWQFSWKSFKNLFGFGWKLMVSGLIDVIWKEVYQLVIGKCYATETLGQYTRGKQFSDIFSTNMTNVIQRVSYPVLSSIQEDKERLKEGYRRIIKVSMYLSFICLFGLGAISEPLITVLIGPQWKEAASYLQIIVFAASLYPLHAINLNMLKVQGRSDLFLKLEIIKKTVAVGPVLLGIFVSIKWMLWGSLVSSVFAYYLNSYYSGRMIGYSMLSQVKDILPSLGIAAVMAVPVYLISLLGLSSILTLFIQLCTGAAIVILLSEFFRLNEYLELKSIVLSFFKRK